MQAKYTKRVYKYHVQTDNGIEEKTLERELIIGGPDPSTLTDEAMGNEGKQQFGPNATLVEVADLSSNIEITVRNE